MQFFKYFAITIVILALVIPSDAGWFRKTVRKIGRGIKKVAKKVEKTVKKAGCKLIFGVACPAAVTGAGALLAGTTSGVGTAIVGAGVIAGKNACHVRKEKCKRSVDMVEVMYPFSDEFSDYDMNGDKLITYREFVLTVLSSVNMADPDELMEPFVFADFDENGSLDTEEFRGAPFLFAHAPHIFANNSSSAVAA